MNIMEERSKVDYRAESVLNVTANVLHVLGVVMALLFFVVSLFGLISLAKEGLGGTLGEILIMLITTVLIYVFCGLLPWAIIKVVLNISNSLMYISDDVQEIKNSLSSKKE